MDINKIIDGIKLALTVGQSVGLPFSSYALILVNLLDKIHEQGGQSPEELSKEIDATIDMNELRIMANLERLKNVPDVPVVAPVAPEPQRSVVELEAKIAELKAKLAVAPEEKRAQIEARIAARELDLQAARERG